MRLIPPPTAVEAVLIALLICAAIYDVRFRRIPNWLSAGGVVAGAALNAFIGPPAGGLVFALKGLALGFGFYFVLYMLRAMGAGDVKLMAAVGSLVGWQNWIGILIATALVGGVAALGIAASRRRIGKTLWNLCFIVSQVGRLRPAYLGNEELDVRSGRSVGLPHGALIAAGTVIFLGLGTYYTR